MLVESGRSAVFYRVGGTRIPSLCVQCPVEFFSVTFLLLKLARLET